jgi:hypothetical protein
LLHIGRHDFEIGLAPVRVNANDCIAPVCKSNLIKAFALKAE